MKCQIGIYNEIDAATDQWVALIDLQSKSSARDLLNTLAPFLKEFHCEHGMDDTQTLAAWLTWHLVEIGQENFDQLSDIGMSREIDAQNDFFVKLSPGLIEIFRIDELLEWRPLAHIEITCDPVQIGAYEARPDAAPGDR
jgi:hypothetical protein